MFDVLPVDDTSGVVDEAAWEELPAEAPPFDVPPDPGRGFAEGAPSLAQLRAALARAVLAVDPDGAADRHKEARRDRRVYVQPEADGMGSLWALLTASDAAGAYQWLTQTRIWTHRPF